MSVFEEYITNKYRRTHYLGSFDRFLRHFNLTDPSYLLTSSNEETYSILKKYILHLRERVENGTLKVNSIRIEQYGSEPHSFRTFVEVRIQMDSNSTLCSRLLN